MLLALGLGGCAALPPATPPAAGTLAAESGWAFIGRIGVQSAEQSLSGQLHWQHQADRDELLMLTPLGQGAGRIVRDAEGVTLELPGQPMQRASDAEALTRALLGYALPVSGLAWWIQARPDPSTAFEADRDAAGRLLQLRQSGWVIDYLQYTENGRPRRLVLAREGLQIRLVADSWQPE